MVDERWQGVKAVVLARDKSCRLLCHISRNVELTAQLIERSNGLHNILDCAHVFSRSAYSHLKYEARNIIILNRYSHSMLDMGKCPVLGHTIPKKDCTAWWAALVGSDMYPLLDKAARQMRPIDDVV